MRVPFLLAAVALALVTSAIAQPAPPPVNQRALLAEPAPLLLSAYRLFTDAGARQPNAGVTPYELNTELYADGALKFRYLYIPPGARAQYRDDGVFEFPVGAALIKTFAFAADMRQPMENLRLLETRLLVRREGGWEARAYVWNQAQSEARLSPIGAIVPVSFTDDAGQAIGLDWAVPNRNQCKACHDLAGALTPVGPSARNLNRDNQLAAWLAAGLIDRVPVGAPRAPDAFDPASGALAARARAYLQVNCAHCHNSQGPARTSGLDLRWNADPPLVWGVRKRPVAAGRGSAGMDFAIEPGHPERSILVSRMASTDPGVMMPELGRQLVDARAVALMRDWIAAMDEDGQVRE